MCAAVTMGCRPCSPCQRHRILTSHRVLRWSLPSGQAFDAEPTPLLAVGAVPVRESRCQSPRAVARSALINSRVSVDDSRALSMEPSTSRTTSM